MCKWTSPWDAQPQSFCTQGLGVPQTRWLQALCQVSMQVLQGPVGSREAGIRLEKQVGDQQCWPSSLKEAGAGPGEATGLLKAVGTRGMLWGSV